MHALYGGRMGYEAGSDGIRLANPIGEQYK